MEYALERDRQDVLAAFRDEFYVQPDTIYLDGNSLGLLSKRAEKATLAILEEWKCLGIEGWMEGKRPWFFLAEQLGAEMAELVGAKSSEVVVTHSTTVNLHQLLATFYRPVGRRNKILADTLNFPSDIYALKSHLRLQGFAPAEHLIAVASIDGHTLNEDQIIDAMTDEVALVLLPSVYYRSGQLLDIPRLTQEAHRRGIVIGIDACHSVGAIPHAFHAWGVDFACWCTYKYLNSGPGGVAALFVHERHHALTPGLTGWFSSKKEAQFDMSHELDVATGAGAYQLGTPHLLSMAPLVGSLEIFKEARVERIRAKSLQLTDYLMALIQRECGEFAICNPLEALRRGGHVCLEHPEAIRICKALKESKVIPDFRAPSLIRLAPIALYTSFVDIYKMVGILKEIMIEKRYESFSKEREVVA